jgi:hypothetical protein
LPGLGRSGRRAINGRIGDQHQFVIPAAAGIQKHWFRNRIPAFAEMSAFFAKSLNFVDSHDR